MKKLDCDEEVLPEWFAMNLLFDQTTDASFNMAYTTGCPENTSKANVSAGQLDFLIYTNFEKVLITIVTPLILVIGVIANLAFIFVVFRVRRMRTVTNYYLLNLGVADILYLIFAAGSKIGRYVEFPFYRNDFSLKAAGCVALNYLIMFPYFASLFLITLVTLEKYYAVCRPVKHRLISGHKRTKTTMVGAWILAGVFTGTLIPAWMGWQGYCVTWPDEDGYRDLPNLLGVCEAISDEMRIVTHGLQTIPFFVAMIANFTMYALIIRAIVARVADREHRQGSIAARYDIQMRNQVVRMLVVNGIVFFLCLAPFEFFSFTAMILDTVGVQLAPASAAKIQMAGLVLSYINASANPFVYSFVNPRYRQAFFHVFTGGVIVVDGGDTNATNTSSLKRLNSSSRRASTSV